VQERDNAPQVRVYYQKPDLTAALKRGRAQIRRLGRRAGMTTVQIRGRETEYEDYLSHRLGNQSCK